jgi:hypothetical protein
MRIIVWVRQFQSLTKPNRNLCGPIDFHCPNAIVFAIAFFFCGRALSAIQIDFADRADQTGFSRFIRELIFSEYLDVYTIERYRHRLSMEGISSFYFALVGQKTAKFPADFLQVLETIE